MYLRKIGVSFSWAMGKKVTVINKDEDKDLVFLPENQNDVSVNEVVCGLDVNRADSGPVTLEEMRQAFGDYIEVTIPTIEGKKLKSGKPSQKILHRGPGAPAELKEKDEGAAQGAS